MTRTRNSPQSGARIYEGDVDTLIFSRVLKDIAQDFHAVHDIVTGENSPSSAPVVLTMNHDGTPLRGSTLGIPVVNQTIDRDCSMPTGGTTLGGSAVILAVPLRVSPGETFLDVEVDDYRNEGDVFTCETVSSSGVSLQNKAMTYDPERNCHSVPLRFTTTGVVVYLFIKTTINVRGPYLGGWRVFAPRLRSTGHAVLGQDGSTTVPVPTAAAGVAMKIATLHDEYFADNAALAGKLVNDLNRNINALMEALTGAPIDGHEAVTNADSGTTNPTTSRFIAHTRAGTGLAAEPLVDFPLWCEALGASRIGGAPMVNNVTPPTTGLTDWFAPFPRDTAASVGRSISCYVPDFPGASTYTATVLAVNESGKGVPGNWRFACRSATGATFPSVALTQLGTTNFWVATFTGIQHAPDAIETFELHMDQNPVTGFVFGEMQILGWSIYLDP